MSILKCKMCGGDLKITAGQTVVECEYCGSRQTIPNVDNEKKTALFIRANRLRLSNEFDKAYSVYESIVAEFPEEAEAYWGLILCHYGIEYVDDPATGKKIPTCHRSSFESVLDDKNFEQVMECADVAARKVYREQAKQIEELRKGIIEVSGKEAPYDIFICYKETDEDGNRTLDSVLAQDVYDALTDKGYRVFFSRITLEDKLGQEYEPYIFAALNSAKVMLAFGTDYEYFNAVWVKNEWSRYLKLMVHDKQKHLIPCFKNIDAYDIPKEFAKLQAQDLGKVGAVQDLLRGIEKLIAKQEAPAQPVVQQVVQQVVQSGGPNVAALLKRGQQALEDAEWEKADAFFDQVLNMDAESAEAFLGKALCDFKVENLKALTALCCEDPVYGETELRQAGQPDTDREAALLEKYAVPGYLEEAELTEKLPFCFDYESFCTAVADREKEVLRSLQNNRNFQRARRYAAGPLKEQLESALSTVEQSFQSAIASESEKDAIRAQELLEQYAQHLANTEVKMQALQKRALAAREVAERKAAKAKRENRIILLTTGIVTLCVCGWLVMTEVVIPNYRYQTAETLLAHGNFDEAAAAFAALAGYKDSIERVSQTHYAEAEALLSEKKYSEAKAAFKALGKFQDSAERVLEVRYAQAEAFLSAGSYDDAIAMFEKLGDYADSADRVNRLKEPQYQYAESLLEAGDSIHAAMTFGRLGNYQDARIRSFALWDSFAQRDSIAAGDLHTVGLKADGTVVAVGKNSSGQCDVSAWKNIVAISANEYHTVGLKADGTVVAAGSNSDGKCDVSAWKDIVAVAAGDDYTVGLKADGTVVAVGDNDDGQCDVSAWKDIVAVAAGAVHTVGLKADGTVVAAGSKAFAQCDVSAWKDIVAVSAGTFYTVGLKADGTVVAVGWNGAGQCDVSAWKDIVAVAAGDRHTVGLKADGTVVAVGSNSDGQCKVSAWKNIKLPAKGTR